MNWFQPKKSNTTAMNLKSYFDRARTWADDTYGAIERSKYRYQVGFIVSMGLNIASIITICVLVSLQTLVPMLVHHYDNGITTIEPLEQKNAPINKAQVESDIVRYISNRESFDSSSYRAQFDLVNVLSNDKVSTEYAREQDKKNQDSPILKLGTDGARTIHIYSINFLDNLIFNEKDIPKNHQNLAEVVFSLTDTDKLTGKSSTEHFSALISWRYVSPSSNPDIRWKNWDGFRVTRYSKQIRNV